MRQTRLISGYAQSVEHSVAEEGGKGRSGAESSIDAEEERQVGIVASAVVRLRPAAEEVAGTDRQNLLQDDAGEVEERLRALWLGQLLIRTPETPFALRNFS